MKNNYKKLLIIIGILLVVVSIGVSFAYFTAAITGSSSDNVVTTGTMALEFVDGPQVTLGKMYPGDSINKTFKVTNTGNVPTTYDLYLSEILNEFVDKNDLVYTIESENGCSNTIDRVVPSTVGEESKMITCSIGVGESHDYTLTIKFIEDNTVQDDNMNKRFKAKISVNEYKNIAILMSELGMKIKESFIGIDASALSEEVLINYFNECSDEESQECINYCNNNTDVCNTIDEMKNYKVTELKVSDEMPEGLDRLVVSDENSPNEIYAWYDNGCMNLYAENSTIYLNENSSGTFRNLSDIEMLDLSKIDASLVKDMSYMFSYFGNENTILNLGDNFDTSNVENMASMFSDSVFASYDFLNQLDMSNVKNTSYMFQNAGDGVDLNLSNFNVCNSTNMKGMFKEAKFTNIDLGHNFNAESATDMEDMFYGIKCETLNLGDNFNAKSATNMYGMFQSSNNIQSINLGDNFNLESDALVYFMFNTPAKNLDMGKNFNGKNITSFDHMFGTFTGETINLGDNFDTSGAKDLSNMFKNSYNMKKLDLGNHFDTSNVKNMSWMFSAMYSLENLYLGDKFFVSSDTDISYLFSYNQKLLNIYVGRNSNFELPNSNGEPFGFNSVLIGSNGTTFDENKVSANYAHIDGGESNPGYFTLDPRYN